MAIMYCALIWRSLSALQSLSGPQPLTHLNPLLFGGVPQGNCRSTVRYLVNGSLQWGCGAWLQRGGCARFCQKQGPVQLTSSWRAPGHTSAWLHEGPKGHVPVTWLHTLDTQAIRSPTPVWRLWRASRWEAGQQAPSSQAARPTADPGPPRGMGTGCQGKLSPLLPSQSWHLAQSWLYMWWPQKTRTGFCPTKAPFPLTFQIDISLRNCYILFQKVHLETGGWEETFSNFINQDCQTSEHHFRSRRLSINLSEICYCILGYLCLLTQAFLRRMNLDFASGFLQDLWILCFLDASPGKQLYTCCLISHGIIANLCHSWPCKVCSMNRVCCWKAFVFQHSSCHLEVMMWM